MLLPAVGAKRPASHPVKPDNLYRPIFNISCFFEVCKGQSYGLSHFCNFDRLSPPASASIKWKVKPRKSSWLAGISPHAAASHLYSSHAFTTKALITWNIILSALLLTALYCFTKDEKKRKEGTDTLVRKLSTLLFASARQIYTWKVTAREEKKTWEDEKWS